MSSLKLLVAVLGSGIHITLYLCHSVRKCGGLGRLICRAGGEGLGGKLVVCTKSNNYVSVGCTANGNSAVGFTICIGAGSSGKSTVGINSVKTYEVDAVVLKSTGKSDAANTVLYRRNNGTGLTTAVTGVCHILLLVRYGRTQNEAKRTGLGRGKSDNHCLIGIGGEVFTAIGYAVVIVLNGGNSGLKIKLSAIVGNRRVCVSEIDVGLGEVVKAVGRERAVAHDPIRVSERFFSKLNTLCFGSAKEVGAEVSVANRNRPALPVIIGMCLDELRTGAEVGIRIVIALGYAV